MRELKTLVAPNPPQGVLVRGHAGFVINKLLLFRRGGGLHATFSIPNKHDTTLCAVFEMGNVTASEALDFDRGGGGAVDARGQKHRAARGGARLTRI